jgi:hypothetical protein
VYPATRIRRKTTTIRATGEIYPNLNDAYEFFNDRLFHGTLPPCLITLQRERATLGYFSPHRFVRYDGQLTHEIAMNPAYFVTRTVKQTLSTLCHEQVHTWQSTHGSPGRRGYHNKEWSAMCEAVGLMPSNTGRPGGARVGEQMDHYIIEGGLFDKAADDFIAAGFRLSWLDRFPAEVPRSVHLEPGYQPPDLDDMPDPGVVVPELRPIELLAPAASVEALVATASDAMRPVGNPTGLPEPSMSIVAPVISWPSDARATVTRTKYRCPGCRTQVWGKPRLDIQCNRCDRNFDEVTGDDRQRRRVS